MNKTRKLTTMAMLFALAIVMSVVESMVMPMFALPAGVKLGLSNIVVMYCMVYMGFASSAELAVMKGLFAFITRGATAGFLSTMGGLFSVTIMFLLRFLLKDKVNYYTLSVFGGLFHNLGQLVGTTFIFGSRFVLYYLPVLSISGVVMGLITGAILTVTIPALKRLG